MRPITPTWLATLDVSLAFDDRGRLFLPYLPMQRNGLPGYRGPGTGGNGIWVLRSGGGGQTWAAPMRVNDEAIHVGSADFRTAP